MTWQQLLFLFVVLFLSFPSAVRASENIRVLLANNLSTVVLGSEAGFILPGRPADKETRRFTYTPAAIGRHPVRIRSAGEFIRLGGKKYRGWVELRKKRNGLLMVINDLDIEDYLLGVVPSEIPHDWNIEAIKAQAVAARTYALYQKRRAGRRSYHILATMNSQVYGGQEGERTRGTRAVRETRGLVVVYHGKVIPAFYHSSCGGHTADAEELWGIDEPYLKGVDCDCQEISKYGDWEQRVGKAQLIAALRGMGYRMDDILGLGIEGITPSGRVRDVVVRTPEGRTLVPAEPLRNALGTRIIPSTFFELEFEDNEAVFSGRGWGHGVGLCQWGAEEMAEQGYDFKAILLHYYPGTKIVPLR